MLTVGSSGFTLSAGTPEPTPSTETLAVLNLTTELPFSTFVAVLPSASTIAAYAALILPSASTAV